ncbi:GNAT family N-acetyltransferase [Liquorilactobacillus capillatus]|uniref:N-acetyltransferase domain-containing protein n=1 Tax=Liquorilactobacillus capillatus DSM 19910 TaxID=1423731 RepID=A0A0R1MGD6_9LACO|nr:GNAT family N-acetyltransferase [Liquorilactobacillus capillatus]KRL03435.1 hypothetical protein FC81_GL002096 [Liquorilactobacillus capillatus DSM 19910]
MTYTVRRAIQSDVESIQTFYNDSLPLINIQQTSWIPNVYPNFSDALNAISKKEFFICLDEQDIVVGSMILNHESDKAYQKLEWLKSEKNSKQGNLIVHTLISHPKKPKKGIASYMIMFIKKYAAENNMASIRLDTFVNNIPARKLYEKNGFSYIGRTELTSFDNNGTDDCVFYEFQV